MHQRASLIFGLICVQLLELTSKGPKIPKPTIKWAATLTTRPKFALDFILISLNYIHTSFLSSISSFPLNFPILNFLGISLILPIFSCNKFWLQPNPAVMVITKLHYYDHYICLLWASVELDNNLFHILFQSHGPFCAPKWAQWHPQNIPNLIQVNSSGDSGHLLGRPSDFDSHKSQDVNS